MGTNVVRLTDRAYMHQLRKSHEADCQAKLQERIDKREVIAHILNKIFGFFRFNYFQFNFQKQEKERQYFLIFRGNYSSENCPHSFKLAHSVALVILCSLFVWFLFSALSYLEVNLFKIISQLCI